jgi:hypothetical protein
MPGDLYNLVAAAGAAQTAQQTSAKKTTTKRAADDMRGAPDISVTFAHRTAPPSE